MTLWRRSVRSLPYGCYAWARDLRLSPPMTPPRPHARGQSLPAPGSRPPQQVRAPGFRKPEWGYGLPGSATAQYAKGKGKQEEPPVSQETEGPHMPPAISAAVDLPMPTTTEAEGQRRPELSFAKVSTSGHRKWMDVMLDGEVVGRVDRIGTAAGELWQPNQGTRERLGGSVPAGAASPEAIKAMMRRSHKRAPDQAASPPEPPAISSAIDMPMGKGADVLAPPAPPAPPPKRERKARPACSAPVRRARAARASRGRACNGHG